MWIKIFSLRLSRLSLTWLSPRSSNYLTASEALFIQSSLIQGGILPVSKEIICPYALKERR